MKSTRKLTQKELKTHANKNDAVMHALAQNRSLFKAVIQEKKLKQLLVFSFISSYTMSSLIS